MTILATVESNLDHLRTLDQPGLTAWGKANGFDSRAGFAGYKKALAKVGIDYEAMRAARFGAAAQKLADSMTHEVTLYSDAKARCQRFAITTKSGAGLWHGLFFDDDRSFSYGDRDEQSACECAAARKAIWLASKIAEAVNGRVRLHLYVDAEWLTTLSGKAAILASDARHFNIDLDMQWIPGVNNPADPLTTAHGYKKWSDNDLAKLAVPVATM